MPYLSLIRKRWFETGCDWTAYRNLPDLVEAHLSIVEFEHFWLFGLDDSSEVPHECDQMAWLGLGELEDYLVAEKVFVFYIFYLLC